MKKLKMKTWLAAALLMLAGGAIFTACNRDKFENDQPDTAGLMAFNLAPGKSVNPAISGNSLTYSPLAFNSYTGRYLSIYPGERTIVWYDYASGDTLASASSDFVAKNYYSSFLVGDDDVYQNVIVRDNVDSLSGSSGKAYFRYINAVNGSASQNVTVTQGGASIVNNNAEFASVSGFIEASPGDITINVAGVNRTITLAERNVYTLLLTSGNTSTDPAQIKFVIHGTLDDEPAGRMSVGSGSSMK